MRCDSCRSTRVYPSRLRNSYERLRTALTGRQPHRCHECNRRAWAVVELVTGDASETKPDDLRIGQGSAPVKPTELDALDAVRSRQ